MKRLPMAALLALVAAAGAARAATEVTPSIVTPNASAALETSHVVPNGALILHGASITTSTIAGFFMVLNAPADPGNGPVRPAKCVAVAATSSATLTADPNTAWSFPAGITLIFSTTGCFTETQSATAYFSWQ